MSNKVFHPIIEYVGLSAPVLLIAYPVGGVFDSLCDRRILKSPLFIASIESAGISPTSS